VKTFMYFVLPFLRVAGVGVFMLLARGRLDDCCR